jgi:putative heme-binding domain-containing protein
VGFLALTCFLCSSKALAQETPAAPTVEKWADRNLKVTRGLQIWLDAAGQNAERRAQGRPVLVNGLPVYVWHDASGHRRDLTQPDAACLPCFHAADRYAAVRFSGDRQHMVRAGIGQSLKDVTAFIVAAPFANSGNFSAFLAMNQAGKNDFVTGLNIDQGPVGSRRFESINVEGAGFGGARNLLNRPTEFGIVQRLCIVSTVGDHGTKLFVNGKPAGERKRIESVLQLDRLTVGARFFTNGGPPQVRGFFEGDISEVIVYDRVLAEAERAEVERYLAAKYGDQHKVAMPIRRTVGKPLVSIPHPPPVQVFVPGFTVRELPVDLTNINNIQYRADGKLVALAYDGNVYLLSDRKGTGLEDQVELFWDNQGRLRAPIGMALTPPGYKHGTGLVIASKGKCSLIVDTKGSGKADREIIIAQGWEEAAHGVDALGAAFHPSDGSIYFGLGTATFTRPYDIDPSGKSRYSLTSERGTILRVSPDFKSREIVCTGIRFSVGLRFNRAGDLFCTDQEGATWLANGNPFDELLHIQKGRHYGFPPRHPRYLPGVIDEPSVFDYGPQHQSTCGLNFNEPVDGGPVFGPAWWQSDALVTGYSRGKLYRTQLVKTDAGYVARNQLLASLNMLAVDACVSPNGDLVVAVHSGGPDWGSGPRGKGKLYKISYTGKDLPQPVLVWPQTPHEVRVAFDRPLDPEQLRNLSGKVAIEYGKYVSAGDRFELHRPGYQVVQDQLRTPRFELPVLSVQVTKDRRTLLLATAAHPEAAGYALTLPGLGRPSQLDESKGELRQVPETDLAYNLAGVETSWRAVNGPNNWTGWLPHLDLSVARQLTAASAAHEELWARCRQPGKLTLRTQLNLWHMLRPAVQPGATIDYEWPAEDITLVFSARADLEVKGPGKIAPAETERDGRRVVRVTLKPTADNPARFEVVVPTGTGDPALGFTYHTNEDPRPRALPLHRLLLPWATLKNVAPSEIVERDIPELKGGNWERGRKVFFSEQAACFRCHAFQGEGGKIGPDLSNLPQRDYASVLRDIVEPSFAINPDYITHVVALKDGRVLTGAVRTEKDRLHIGDNQGKVTTVERNQIETLETSPVSIMPDGIPKLLGPDRMRDLLTFLLTAPPRLVDYGKGPPPEPRSRAAVQAVLAGAPQAPARLRPLHIVLVAGKKDHGPGEHDYPAWQKVWQKLLALGENIRVTTAEDWPAAVDLKSAAVLVFYQKGKWTPERARDIDAFLARGGGLVYIHYAVDGGADAPGFAQRIGLAWKGGQSKFRHGPLDLGFQTGARHPIARNFDKVHFHDESYWNLVGDVRKVHLLASAIEEGQPQPLFWTLEPSQGRVFVSIPGHYSWTFDDPLFRILLLRGIAWCAREPVDCFNGLVLPGARIKD